MSEEPSLAELQSLLKEEYTGLISDIQEKKAAEKEAVIVNVTALSTELGQEIKKEELDKMEAASLNMLEKQLKNLLDAKNAGQGGEPPLSGNVPRGGEPEKLTKLETNNIIIEMITHSFGLPRPSSEKPKKGEMSGAEYDELCEEVRMEHYGQGLRY